MTVVCEQCRGEGGHEGDPPMTARYLVSVTGPEGPAVANAPLRLCIAHAATLASSYLGYGWGVEARLLNPRTEATLRSWRGSLDA